MALMPLFRKLAVGLALAVVGALSTTAPASAVDSRISPACSATVNWAPYVPRLTEATAYWSSSCTWDEYAQVVYRLALGDNRLCAAWGEEWVEYEAWAARQVLYGLWSKGNYAGAIRWAAEHHVRFIPNGDTCR